MAMGGAVTEGVLDGGDAVRRSAEEPPEPEPESEPDQLSDQEPAPDQEQERGALRRLVAVASVGSTNAELQARYARAPGEWPHLSALIAGSQTAGRGRLGRTWETPPGQAMTASLVLQPQVSRESLGWITILTGLAVSRAIAALPAADPGRPRPSIATKWPNDVLVGGAPYLEGWGEGRKVAGILTELLPVSATPPTARTNAATPTAVIVGIGINLTQGPEHLPVPSATSLREAGIEPLEPRAMLLAVAAELAPILHAWEASGGGAPPAELREAVRQRSWTLGRDVRVDLPGGRQLTGQARDLDEAGHLLVLDTRGEEHVVLAGDVQHVRAASAG